MRLLLLSFALMLLPCGAGYACDPDTSGVPCLGMPCNAGVTSILMRDVPDPANNGKINLIACLMDNNGMLRWTKITSQVSGKAVSKYMSVSGTDNPKRRATVQELSVSCPADSRMLFMPECGVKDIHKKYSCGFYHCVTVKELRLASDGRTASCVMWISRTPSDPSVDIAIQATCYK